MAVKTKKKVVKRRKSKSVSAIDIIEQGYTSQNWSLVKLGLQTLTGKEYEDNPTPQSVPRVMAQTDSGILLGESSISVDPNVPQVVDLTNGPAGQTYNLDLDRNQQGDEIKQFSGRQRGRGDTNTRNLGATKFKGNRYTDKVGEALKANKEIAVGSLEADLIQSDNKDKRSEIRQRAKAQMEHRDAAKLYKVKCCECQNVSTVVGSLLTLTNEGNYICNKCQTGGAGKFQTAGSY